MVFGLEIMKTKTYNSRDVRKAPCSDERTVPTYEIELCTADYDGTNYVNGEAHPCEVGRILVARPGMRRYTKGHFECQFVHFICHDRAFEDKYLRSLQTTLRLGNETRAPHIFHALTSAWAKREDGYEVYCVGKLMELISSIYSAGKLLSSMDEKYRRFSGNIVSATEYMRTNFASPLTLEDIAGAAHISPSYFHLIFKNSVGVTPARYLLDVRMREAQKLLINTSLPLSDVAGMCGFDSQSYFTDVFRREEGVTPGKFRRDNADIIM